jgi:hypothetical protein
MGGTYGGVVPRGREEHPLLCVSDNISSYLTHIRIVNRFGVTGGSGVGGTSLSTAWRTTRPPTPWGRAMQLESSP